MTQLPLSATERRGLAAILLLGAIPRIWAAAFDHGMVWPDEIYLAIEPAHRAVFGYGIESWGEAAGLNSWVLPGFVAVVLKLLSICGVETGLHLVTGVKLVMAGIAVLGLYGSMRLAAAVGGAPAALLTGLLSIFFPLSIVLGSRCLADAVGGTVLVFAVLAIWNPRDARPVLSGALCGLAVFIKYQNGIVLLGVLVWLAAAHRFDDLKRWLLAALVLGWAGGLLDWMTWGAPFHSLRAYLDYNILQNRSTVYGEADPAAYARWAWSLTGPALLAIAAGVVLAWRRMRAPIAIALVFVLIHAAIPHKEMRFLLPVVPLLLAAAGVGLAVAFARLRVAILCGMLLAALLGQRAVSATLADLGGFANVPAGALSAWHTLEGANRLLSFAGARADTCGVWVSGVRTPFVGGYSYLHRDVPLLWGAEPYNAFFSNYLLMPMAPLPFPVGTGAEYSLARPPAGFAAIGSSRGWMLYSRPGPCAKAPPAVDDRRIYE